jgi:hypothetical protein
VQLQKGHYLIPDFQNAFHFYSEKNAQAQAF